MCVAFRVKLSRDTGVNLAAADCVALLEATFEAGAYTRPLFSLTRAYPDTKHTLYTP